MCCVMPPASRSATRVVADRVEQRRLAVIDVAHDRNDRPARDQVLRIGGLVALGGDFLLEAAGLDFRAKARGQRLGHVEIDRGVDGHHQAAIEQRLERVLDADLETIGQVLHRHAFREGDGAGDRRRRRGLRLPVADAAARRASAPASCPTGDDAVAADGNRDAAACPGRCGMPPAGRTGCDGSGRGPPSIAAVLLWSGRGWPNGRCPCGRARLPVAACGGRGDGGTTRGGCGTSWRFGCSGGALGGALPGSSTRRRMLGGTKRPAAFSRDGLEPVRALAAAIGGRRVSAGATGSATGARRFDDRLGRDFDDRRAVLRPAAAAALRPAARGDRFVGRRFCGPGLLDQARRTERRRGGLRRLRGGSRALLARRGLGLAA